MPRRVRMSRLGALLGRLLDAALLWVLGLLVRWFSWSVAFAVVGLGLVLWSRLPGPHSVNRYIADGEPGLVLALYVILVVLHGGPVALVDRVTAAWPWWARGAELLVLDLVSVLPMAVFLDLQTGDLVALLVCDLLYMTVVSPVGTALTPRSFRRRAS